MIIYRDVVALKLQGGVDRLFPSVVCILVEDKDNIFSLCIVINSLGVNGACWWENIRDDAYITSGNAVICSSVN